MHVLAVTLSLAATLLFWRITREWKTSWPLFILAVIASCLVVILSQKNLWQAAYAGYPTDSFFDLDTYGRLGVLAISSLSILLFFALLAKKSKWFLRLKTHGLLARVSIFITDCIIGLGLFGFLYSLTPQIYYTFYRLIFPDLPNQIVIKSLFHWEKIKVVATFVPDGTLSNYLAGIVLLAIIPFTAWLHGMHEEWRKDSLILMVFATLTLQYASFY